MDFLRVGNFCYNLAHVRQIFEDRETPGTWNVMYEMGTDPRTGAGLISGQVFTGEEGEALKFWLHNNIPDTLEIYQLSKGKRPRPTPVTNAIRTALGE